MLKSFKLLIVLIIIIVCSIVGYQYWLHQQFFPTTDDAYVQTHIVNIAPSISGTVLNMHVRNHQQVKIGEVLFVIDPLPYKIALSKAESQLKNIQEQITARKLAVQSAQLAVKEQQQQVTIQQREADRTLTLVQQQIVAAQTGDEARDKVNAAKAQLANAKSNLANAQASVGDADSQIKVAQDDVKIAKLKLNYTYIVAPANGTINNMDLRPGDSVNAYQAAFALVEDNHYWITANFKETQIQRIQKGQTAKVYIDMYPNHIFTGVVESISTGSGTSFSLIPTEQATGNWIKVTQRFPVKIALSKDDAQRPLRIGASATVSINTKSNNIMFKNKKY